MAMSDAAPRFVQVVHVTPGRVRLRLPWLRKAQEEADAVADRIAAIEGVAEVQVRAFTGSVLCLFDEEQLEVDELVAAAARAVEVDRVVRAGDKPPAPPPLARPGDGHRSSVARALTRSVREINADTLNATDGRLDLGTMAFLAFISAGAAEIVFSRQLPAPPWFNLAWWAVQAFTAYESGDEPDAAE
jgi:hypothetical protein